MRGCGTAVGQLTAFSDWKIVGSVPALPNHVGKTSNPALLLVVVGWRHCSSRHQNACVDG